MDKKSTQNQNCRVRDGHRSATYRTIAVFLLCLLGMVAALTAYADQGDGEKATPGLTVYQVLQKVIDSYPSLQISALKVQQAQAKVAQIRGQLDWQLQAMAGVAREPGLFLGTMDTLKGSANFSRRLENGDSVGVFGAVNRSDSEMNLSPTFPNPSYNTQIRLNYRKPLLRDRGFPSYTQDLNNAELNIQLAEKNRLQIYENLSGQVIAIFYAVNTTVRQVENINQSLQRTKRLKKFIEGRLNLGIAENKDMLQILAQIDTQNAQLMVLDAAMKQQIINLNRLLVNDWNAPLQLAIKGEASGDISYPQNLELVKKHSPLLAVWDIQLQIVQNNLDKIRDMNQDNADLVLYAGAQSVTGDSTLGSVSENDSIGGISVEYKIRQSNNTKAAYLKEAQLYQDNVLVEKKHAIQDIQYDVAELVSGISSFKEAVSAYEKSVASEKKKLEDAEQRYRRGRIDIDRVIGFENQLAAAELLLELQRIETERRVINLSVLNGEIWKTLHLPDLSLDRENP